MGCNLNNDPLYIRYVYTNGVQTYIEEFGDLMDRNECENNPTSSTMIIIVATKSQAQVPNGN